MTAGAGNWLMVPGLGQEQRSWGQSTITPGSHCKKLEDRVGTIGDGKGFKGPQLRWRVSGPESNGQGYSRSRQQASR